MHRILIWNLANALQIEKNQLLKQGATNVPSGIRLNEESRRAQKRLNIVEADLQKCKEFWDWHVHCNQQSYTDPIFVQQTECLSLLGGGLLKKHEAKKLLVKRVYSGLKNLSEMQERGEEFLHNRGIIQRYDDDTGEAVEWVDGEKDYLIDDDVDLVEDQIVWVPSRRWENKNMKRLDDINVEMTEAADWEQFAKTAGGVYNKMDGRYHSHAARFTEKAINDHWYRTENRRTCSFYFGKKGCKYDYNCTLRHFRTETEWQFMGDLKKGKINKRPHEYTEEETEMYTHFGGSSSSGGRKRQRTQM